MSSLAVNSITDASGGTTTSINGHTPTASNMAGKNRVINGSFVIDQRNAGSAYTANASGIYMLDRWSTRNNGGSWGTGVFSVVQSTTAPAGFSKSMSVTVTTADTSITSTDAYIISQLIEGNNTADLNWGTSDAQTVTLSFWVRSSLTGTFAGSITSTNNDRGYIFTYAISTADTWQKVEATIPGDTVNPAHWPTNNSVSFRLNFDLGSGSAREGTADTWQATGVTRTSGSVRLVETASATWYLTGVQLEIGSSATEFEHRQYGQELALCQRYCYALRTDSLGYTQYGRFPPAFVTSTTECNTDIFLPQPMRSTAYSLTYNNKAFQEYYQTGAGATGSTILLNTDANGTNWVNVQFSLSGSALNTSTGLVCGIRFTNATDAVLIISTEL